MQERRWWVIALALLPGCSTATTGVPLAVYGRGAGDGQDAGYRVVGSRLAPVETAARWGFYLGTSAGYHLSSDVAGIDWVLGLGVHRTGNASEHVLALEGGGSFVGGGSGTTLRAMYTLRLSLGRWFIGPQVNAGWTEAQQGDAVLYEFGSAGVVGGYRFAGFTLNATTRVGLGWRYFRSHFSGTSSVNVPTLSLGVEAGYGF